MAPRWGGVFGRRWATRRGDRHPSAAARSGGHRAAPLSRASPTLHDARGGPRRAGHAGALMAIPPGGRLHPERPQTLCLERPPDAPHTAQGHRVAEASPGPASGRADEAAAATPSVLGRGEQYARVPVERCRGDPGLQRPGPGRRGIAVSQRSAVLGLVVDGEKTLPYARAVDGDDGGCARLCSGATQAAPAMGATPEDRAEPHASTNATADLALDRATPGTR